MSSRRSIYILLGSNLKRPVAQLAKAKVLIELYLGQIVKASSLFKTAPWGKVKQPNFINQVIKLYSSRAPGNILNTIKKIEAQMGRIPGIPWGPRIIDLDILFIGYQRIKNKELTVPHPRIGERMFTLAPLNELIPDFRHPVTGITIHSMYITCSDRLSVQKLN